MLVLMFGSGELEKLRDPAWALTAPLFTIRTWFLGSAPPSPPAPPAPPPSNVSTWSQLWLDYRPVRPRGPPTIRIWSDCAGWPNAPHLKSMPR